MIVMNLGKLTREKTAFVLIDVQEKFVPVMGDADKIVHNINILTKAAEILKIPLIVTEQYPKGLGKTYEKIHIPNADVIEKIEFSCFDNKEFFHKIKEKGVNSLVLFGVESHVCVLKTALDAIENGIEVHVVADAVSSRTEENRKLALKRMRQSGVFIVSTEMIIFQLMEKAGTEEFKRIGGLVK